MVLSWEAMGSASFQAGRIELIFVFQVIAGERLLSEIKSPVASASKSYKATV
jgi:hypothetical protein